MLKKNKNLINDEIKVSRVKSNGGSDRIPTKKQKSTRDLLVEFMGEQREFNKSVIQKFNEQAKFNKQQLEFNKFIKNEFSNLNNRFDNLVKINNLKE